MSHAGRPPLESSSGEHPPAGLAAGEDTRPFGPLRDRAARLARLSMKELREILRDRRTIFTLVLMPLLLYPLLSLAFQKFLVTELGARRTERLRIGIPEEEAGVIKGFLDLGARRPRTEPAPAGAQPEQPGPILEFFSVRSLERAAREYDIDLGIRLRGEAAMDQGPDADVAVDFEVVYLDGNSTAREALENVTTRLRRAGERVLRRRLRDANLTQRVMPLRVIPTPVENPEPATSISLAALIPLVLILMTITGAVYPAIDLTAGERERGTLEMLVAAPVPRLSLLFAKYFSVVTVAFLTAAINLVSMMITIQTSGLGPLLWGAQGLSAATIAEIFGLLLLFAAFFSSVLLTLTSFARSFKEAQAYLIPLMLFSISPGLVSLIPGLELSGWLLITPLLNIALLSRDLLEGHANPGSAALVVLSTCLFALAGISLAARIFGSESVLYETQTGWSDLFWRERRRQAAPRLSSALLCLAFMFPALFLATNTIARLAQFGVGVRLCLVSLGTALIFGAFPLASAWHGRVDWRSGFRLVRPPRFTIAAAVLLGLSLWPFAHELTMVAQMIGLGAIKPEHFAKVKAMLEQCRTLSPLAVLLAFAVFPATFEELFFRGYMFSALSARSTPWKTILASGVLFGVFHLVATDALAVERLLPSTFLGFILGWICWRTGSILPGIALHCCHNGFLIMVFYYQPELTARGWGIAEETQHLPGAWLAAAAVGCLAGLALIQSQTAPRAVDTAEAPTPAPLS